MLLLYSGFTTLDLVVFIGYALVIVFMGLWVSRTKKGEEKSADDYFLASKMLPWWAIGTSLIASNISAEQFIGMSGSGYRLGLSIATYEWMAAVTLLVVGFLFLPVFIRNNITTMPQFLLRRFDSRVATVMSFFWVLLYIFVNLTSVMYLGARALEEIMGVPVITAIISLALFAILYSLAGGLAAVAWTDVVQVIVLLFGGIITTWLALDAVSNGNGIVEGFKTLLDHDLTRDKFHMILHEGQYSVLDKVDMSTKTATYKDPYSDLPGLSVLIGGMWVANLAYWGFNQYIIQRGLAAKSLDEARKGIVLAGFLKILMPFIIVIPGIAAVILFQRAEPNAEFGLYPADKAYPWLVNHLLPSGLKGLAFAGLAAAIVSSLASMMNSTSTIFTYDIYKRFINPGVSDKNMVKIGRISALTAVFIALIAAYPIMGSSDQVFQNIQEYSGFVTPGVCVIFILGLFWPKFNGNGALAVAIGTFVVSIIFKFWLADVPFIDRMGYNALILITLGALVSYAIPYQSKSREEVVVESSMFRSDAAFKIGSALILAIIFILYYRFW